jgi:solute carrier family 35 (adenosine 3'-phospho 5'-phosphosulfate transporter), member B2
MEILSPHGCTAMCGLSLPEISCVFFDFVVWEQKMTKSILSNGMSLLMKQTLFLSTVILSAQVHYISRLALLLLNSHSFSQASDEPPNPNVYRSNANVGDVLYMIAVNFLLYVTLIIVFYMLVRFYLEEETSVADPHLSYIPLPVQDDAPSDLDIDSSCALPDKKGIELTGKGAEEEESDQDILNESKSPKKNGSIKRVGSFLNVNEWVEPEGTKMEVIQRVIFCAVGLNISFSIWGLVQERMLTYPYNGDYFIYSYGLVFLNRLGGLILSAVLMSYYKVTWVTSPLYEFSFPSVANMLSSWCQYEALKYVSFPTQMLAKALKLVPVMLMGKFINNKTYETYEYICGAMIGFGIYLFLSSSESIEFGQDLFGNPEGVRGIYCGLVLLSLYLFFDSFTSQWQTRMFELKKEMSPLQMMLVINAFSTAFSFITLVHQEELTVSLTFVYNHPVIMFHMVIFTLCSTIGQLYIFYTVKNFGAVVFSIIMSLRILTSILLSCLVYSHPVTELGFIGITIVFGSITYRIMRKTKGRSLLSWKQEDIDEAKNTVHEWHEHLDI